MKPFALFACVLTIFVTTVQKAQADGYARSRVVVQQAPVYAAPPVLQQAPVYAPPVIQQQVFRQQVVRQVRVQQSFQQSYGVQQQFAPACDAYGCAPALQQQFAPSVYQTSRQFAAPQFAYQQQLQFAPSYAVQQQFAPAYGSSVQVNVGRQGGIFRQGGFLGGRQVIRTRTVIR